MQNMQSVKPKIIYGTAWKKEATADWVEKALLAGFIGIDTACQPKHYNEALVGEGVARYLSRGHRRESLFIQTKYTSVGGQDPAKLPYDPKASLADQVDQSLKVSLENLQTDYLDSWLLHGPLPTLSQTMEVWQAMETHCDNAYVKQIGISNFYHQDFFEAFLQATRIKPAVLQNRFYQQTNYDCDIRRQCRQENISYQSFWTLTANPHILNSQLMVALAKKTGKTPVQLFFCYLAGKGITPLTGTTNVEHMQQDLASFAPPFDNEMIEQLDRLIPH